MKVFVAGANGVVGMELVPQLVAAGYEVAALTRSAEHAPRLRALGAEPVVADALDRDAIMRALQETRPEVVIHELTALIGIKDLKHFDAQFALTNRLRTEGTDNLLAAAQAVGARRFITQSFGNWNYAPTGSAPKTEEDALVSHPLADQVKTLQALRYLEDATLNTPGVEGVALRYANLYGPDTGFAHDGVMATTVRKRMLPVIGDGAGVWSFTHVADAASAAVAAIQHGAPGVYNVCDDEPAPVNVWLPAYARAIGAPRPLRVPVWLGRLLAGEVTVSFMTQIRGASNAKAKRDLDWMPAYASWRQGFQTGLG